MKSNNKGQALIEFVLILPIFLFMIFVVVDIGRIIYTKILLESKIVDTVDLLQAKKSYDEVKTDINKNSPIKIDLSIQYQKDNYATIKVSSDIKFVAPGLNKILTDPYEVFAIKEVPYEQ